MGGLFLVSGVCFVAGVLNPPLLRTWGDSVPQSVAVAAAHRTAWFTSAWLITLSIAAAVAAVELLTRVLDCDAARVGRSLYLVGATLGLASTAYDLAVTSALLGTTVLPGWYLGMARWAGGLGTAYFALLAPASLTAFGAAIFRTRALPPLDRDNVSRRGVAAVRPVRRVPRGPAIPTVPGVHRARRHPLGPDTAHQQTHRKPSPAGQAPFVTVVAGVKLTAAARGRPRTSY
jgi:hypothetical protein